MTKSLWPDEISVIKEVPPVSILREQAALLGEKTKNLVVGEVNSRAGVFGDEFYDTFYLVAPTLNNYRYELFKVSRHIEHFYPVKISADTLDIRNREIASENELIEVLENIFSHSKTVKIIQSMLAQSGWEPNEVPF